MNYHVEMGDFAADCETLADAFKAVEALKRNYTYWVPHARILMGKKVVRVIQGGIRMASEISAASNA